jgi:2-oxoglutarate ferredoxin oxidoreductase subunit beta
MSELNLITRAKNVWCPGCGNFAVERALVSLFQAFPAEGIPLEDIVIVTGIGQHGKLFDYLNVNGFYAIHGRTIPVATGIKLANPDLHVIAIAGDGDCYAEGIEHFIFGAKRNVDITVLVHDNRVYALTTGQYGPTAPEGFRGRSTPGGTLEHPINPLALALVSGATFIGRGYTRRADQLASLIKEGFLHRGFSFIDILQVCVTYYNQTEYYDAHVYDWEDNGTGDFNRAFSLAREWDYNSDAPIGLGVLYSVPAPTFGDRYPFLPPQNHDDRKTLITKILEERT